MSANNIIYVDRKTFKVYLKGCVDNPGHGDLMGRGKTLEEAIDIAEKLEEEYMVEYGINFINKLKVKPITTGKGSGVLPKNKARNNPKRNVA